MRPPKTYILVFHGTWENEKLIDVGDDPCFQSPPTWGICRPNVRGSWIKPGDTLFFLCCIDHSNEYFLKGWFEVGELISYPEALIRFPGRLNVIISRTLIDKNVTWTKGNRKRMNMLFQDKTPPEFLARIKSKQGDFYHTSYDDHCTDEWKCKRIFRCDYKQLDKCIEQNSCAKDGVDINDYSHYIVSHPEHWEDVDYLRICIEDIQNNIGWSDKIKTPINQHNALKFTKYKDSLLHFINEQKKSIKTPKSWTS